MGAELEINHASRLHISREPGERRASQSNKVDLLEKYMITHTSEEAFNAFLSSSLLVMPVLLVLLRQPAQQHRTHERYQHSVQKPRAQQPPR